MAYAIAPSGSYWRLAIFVGSKRLRKTLRPSWSLLSLPQAQKLPFALSARLKLLPAAIFAHPLPRTRVGALRVTLSPRPSWPEPFSPQAHSEPSRLRARPPPCAAATAFHELPVPTRVGTERSTVSRPPPQAHSEPPRLIAKLGKPPAEIAVQSRSLPTRVGVGCARSSVVPRPSWPRPLPPQAHSEPSRLRARTESSPTAIAFQSLDLPTRVGRQ